MAQSASLLPGLVDPHPAGADYRAIPAQEVGGRLEENAPAVGQPRGAQAITESGGHSRAASLSNEH
jgi:hypothetical protein